MEDKKKTIVISLGPNKVHLGKFIDDKVYDMDYDGKTCRKLIFRRFRAATERYPQFLDDFNSDLKTEIPIYDARTNEPTGYHAIVIGHDRDDRVYGSVMPKDKEREFESMKKERNLLRAKNAELTQEILGRGGKDLRRDQELKDASHRKKVREKDFFFPKPEEEKK